MLELYLGIGRWIVIVKVIAKVRVKDRIRGRRAFIFHTYGMQLYM